MDGLDVTVRSDGSVSVVPAGETTVREGDGEVVDGEREGVPDEGMKNPSHRTLP